MNKNLKTCPVCKGRGSVPIEHPPNTPDWVKETKFPFEPCAACNGSQVVTKEKFDDYHNSKD